MSVIYDEDFINLNMDYINKTSQNDIRRLLNDRTSNLEHDNFIMDYERIITITAIDHLVCKKMLDNSPVGLKTKIYLDELDKQLVRQPLLFLSLPIRRLNVTILRKYLPHVDRVINICRQKEIQAKEINKKFKVSGNVSQGELNFLIKYFNYSSVNDDDPSILEAQDRMARYLLNNSSSLDLQALSFLVKYFGYKQCRVENLNGIQILIGDLNSCDSETLGISLNKSIVLSKNAIVQSSFLENKLTNEFSRLSNGKLEGLVCLNLLFHELRHVIQNREHLEKKISDMSYAMSTRKILFENDKHEYSRNYELYNTESDANQYSWRCVGSIIREYMEVSEKDRLAIYSDMYFLKYTLKKMFAVKLDINNKGRFSGCFEKEELDNYFKKNPKSLRGEYSHFSVFYNADGSPKSLNELIRLGSSFTFNFKTFYANQVSARIVSGESFDYNAIDKLNVAYKLDILRNFYNIIFVIFQKFNILTTKRSNGKYIYDDLSKKERSAILYNVNRYFKLLTIYSDEVRKFIFRYPELLDYSDTIQSINSLLNAINANSIIQDLLGSSKIDLIQITSNKGDRKNGRK